MDAKTALTRFALGTMTAATLWVGPVYAQADRGYSESSMAVAGGHEGSGPGASDDAMQPVYQGSQQVVSFYGRALDVAVGQLTSLMQNLARNALKPSDTYEVSWSAKERYPLAITPTNQTVGFTKDEIQFLTKRGTWVTVREAAGHERVVLAAVHAASSNAIVSVAIPLSKFTGAVDPFRIGRDGRAFLIDGAGNILNNPGRRLNVDREALVKMLGDELGTLETRGTIISFSRIPAAEWFLLLEVPKVEAKEGLVFPSEMQLKMQLPLEPPVEIVRVHSAAERLLPAAGILTLLGLGGLLVPYLFKRREKGKKKKKDRQQIDTPAYDLADLDNPTERPLISTEKDKLGKASRAWSSIEEAVVGIPQGGDLAATARVKMVLRQQGRDQERMLQQLQHSMELTISETRDQIHEVLNAHQGKIKGLGAALEQTRNNLLYKADGEALATLVDDLKTRLFQAEADSRTASAGVEKRVATLTRKFGDMESTLGKAVAELQEKLGDDLLGRQEAISRAMETLEAKTREAQRQVMHDAAAAKLSSAQAAENTAHLDAEMQELKTRTSFDIEDARKQASAEVGLLRTQLSGIEDVRAELKDSVARFSTGQAEWEENGRLLSKRVNEELANFQQRIFHREGDVEKIRLVVDQAVVHIDQVAHESEVRRERLERDLDTLKGKVYLGDEEMERFRDRIDARLALARNTMDQEVAAMKNEVVGEVSRVETILAQAAGDASADRERSVAELDRRFAAHIAETERRISEAIAEALASAMAAIARVDAARVDGEQHFDRGINNAMEKAEDVAARAERARARLEDKLTEDAQKLEAKLLDSQHQAIDKLGQWQAEATMTQEAFRNEVQVGRERDLERIVAFEEKIDRVDVRAEQARTRLEDELKGDYQALHQDLIGRHMALREEIVAAQEVFQADFQEMRQKDHEDWLGEVQGQLMEVREEQVQARSHEERTREAALEALREAIATMAHEVRTNSDAHRQALHLEMNNHREQQLQSQSQLEQALGELARKVASDLTDYGSRNLRIENSVQELSGGLESLHGQLMQEAATSQDILRRVEGRMAELAESTVARSEDLAHRTEQLVASAITALPDHPELIGLHRDLEHLRQESFRGRDDLDQLRDLIDRNMRELSESHNEHYTKLSNLVQVLLKLYQSARETDEKVSKVLSSQQNKVEGLHQEVLAIRSMVVIKPLPGGAPMPIL